LTQIWCCNSNVVGSNPVISRSVRNFLRGHFQIYYNEKIKSLQNEESSGERDGDQSLPWPGETTWGSFAF